MVGVWYWKYEILNNCWWLLTYCLDYKSSETSSPSHTFDMWNISHLFSIWNTNQVKKFSDVKKFVFLSFHQFNFLYLRVFSLILLVSKGRLEWRYVRECSSHSWNISASLTWSLFLCCFYFHLFVSTYTFYSLKYILEYKMSNGLWDYNSSRLNVSCNVFII